MSKKTIFILALVVLFLGGFVYYRYCYQPQKSQEEQIPETQQQPLSPETPTAPGTSGPTTEEKPATGEIQTADFVCPKNETISTIILDGSLEKMENNRIYVKPEAEEKAKILVLSSETKFLELTLSSAGKLAKEKQIERQDLKVGNQLSVVIICETATKYTVQAVRRMILQ